MNRDRLMLLSLATWGIAIFCLFVGFWGHAFLAIGLANVMLVVLLCSPG